MTSDVRTEHVTACPLCGDARARVFCRARDRQHGVTAETFTFVRCRPCGIVYQATRPVEADAGALYPSEYEPYRAVPDARAAADTPGGPAHPLGSRVLAAVERLNDSIRRRRPDPLGGILDALYAPPRSEATLLDFGCGSAAFLDRAAGLGWRTIGCDFAPAVVDAVRRAGHRAFVSDELWDAIPDGSLDVVRMNHVIEHLYAPRPTLAGLQRKLRPGGRLHLATPNAASLSFRILRGRWFPLECPRHVVIFTPAAAARLLREVGFATVACHQEVLTKDTARSLGYVLEDLGRIGSRQALDLMHQSGLATALFAPARVAALFGMADRFHAIARRAA